MKPLKAYACYNKNDDIRMKSSSGAIFSSLASYVFALGGIIYGVAMTEDCYSAEFISATDEIGLEKIRGSKYLQAKVGDTYKLVKADLIKGRIVLFSGTGCQINGLKCFLGKEYDNLICVDVICHGVPSPALWCNYVQYQEQKHRGKLKSVNFRCKDENWIDFGMQETLENIQLSKIKKLYISKNKDSYMQMFLRNYSLRPSCYKCVAKNIKMSDLTIADFWGINDVAPEINDNMGVSLVLIRTDKGKRIFEAISPELKFKEVSYESGVKRNSAEYHSVAKPYQRNNFFIDMECMSFEELEKKYASPIKYSKKTELKRRLKRIIKSIIRMQGAYKNVVVI